MNRMTKSLSLGRRQQRQPPAPSPAAPPHRDDPPAAAHRSNGSPCASAGASGDALTGDGEPRSYGTVADRTLSLSDSSAKDRS
jgi:hypothetical protein